MKAHALLFLPYLAPYRIDVLNELGTFFNLTVVFQFENAPEQNFNQTKLREQLKVKFVIFNTGFNIGTRQIRIGVYKLLNRYKPDVVFSNEYGLTSILLSCYKRLKIFDFIHLATTSDNVKMATETKWFRRIARTLVLSNTSGIVVYNKDVQEWYKKHFPKIIVRVCPNIQNPSFILKNIEAILERANKLKKQYKIEDTTNILFVGRLHEVKGIQYLFKAFSKINNPLLRIILVGEGPFKQELQNLAIKLGISNNIIWAGRHEHIDLLAWYKTSNFSILPSTHEPFGAVVNESLILGVPVLCSKYAGAKFYINQSMNGYIFNPLNEVDFTETLKKAINQYHSTPLDKNLMEYPFEESVEEYYKSYKEATQKL